MQTISLPRTQPTTNAVYPTFPILFSSTMVRALINGRKTETRRPVSSPLARAMPGDRLWVRETWHVSFRDDTDVDRPPRTYHDTPKDQRVVQLAHEVHYFEEEMRKAPAHRFMPARWIPSIHMNRWASRLTLIVKEVRFCRLQDITDAEAIAGGVGEKEVIGPRARRHPASGNRTGAQSGQFGWHWDSLYRKPGSRLADNPEVVSLAFSVHRCTVERLFSNAVDGG